MGGRSARGGGGGGGRGGPPRLGGGPGSGGGGGVVATAVGLSLFTTAAPASAVVPLEGASRAVAATPTKPVAKDAKKKKKKVVKKVVKKVAKAKALKPVKLQILSIADLHGYLQPPSDRAGQLTVAGGG